jgi:hypothetical protein
MKNKTYLISNSIARKLLLTMFLESMINIINLKINQMKYRLCTNKLKHKMKIIIIKYKISNL